jgi:hypothetical protein
VRRLRSPRAYLHVRRTLELSCEAPFWPGFVSFNSLLCGAVILRTLGPAVARGLGKLEDRPSPGLGLGHTLEVHVRRARLHGQMARTRNPPDGVDQDLIDGMDGHVLRCKAE